MRTSTPTAKRYLIAFQQVEDYLSATHTLSQQIVQQRQAVDSTQQALDFEMGRYQSGIDPYIDVVTLQTSLVDEPEHTGKSASGTDDQRGLIDRSPGRRLGYFATAYNSAGHRQANESGDPDSALERYH